MSWSGRSSGQQDRPEDPEDPGSENAREDLALTPIGKITGAAARTAARSLRDLNHQEVARVTKPSAQIAASVCGNSPVGRGWSGDGVTRRAAPAKGSLNFFHQEREGITLRARKRAAEISAHSHQQRKREQKLQRRGQPEQ